MQWSEQAIILSSRKFGESGLLIEVFAKSKGLYSGMVRGGQSKSKANIYQAGNIIDATWYSRLEDQLGTFSGELVNAVSAKVIHDQKKLLALISLTSILRKTLIDRQPYDDLYNYYAEFFTEALHEENWLTEYVWMEVALLRYLGFGLDLSCCAVSGKTEGLEFLSPRTGRAATAEASKGYEDKLFTLPRIFTHPVSGDKAYNQVQDILNALEITEYFITKNLFAPHSRKLPEERQRFVLCINKAMQNTQSLVDNS